LLPFHTRLRSLLGALALCASTACVGIISDPGSTGVGDDDDDDNGGAGIDGGNPGGTGTGGENNEPFEAAFLWQPITFDDAVDLGFEAAAIPADQQVAPGAVTLSEVAVEAGLGDSTAGGNSHGVGVGFIDIDNDSYEDIFLATGAGTDSQVYRNDGDGTFSDFTTESNVGAILGGVDTYSVAAGDYDRDGDLDIYVGAHPRDYLLQNNGAGQFTDVTLAAGAGGPASAQPGSASKIVSWGDYDGDGLLDMAVASSTLSGHPENGYLLRNDGDGTFTDVTSAAGFAAAPTGNPCAVMWSDFDSDGDQDVWIWNDRGDALRNRALLRNDSGVFTDITEQARLTEMVVGNPMGIDSADVDHDGDLDYYVSDIGGSPFLHNDADGTFRDIQDVSGARGDYGWGLAFEDFDADTWPDIFLAQEDSRPYMTFTNLGEELPRFSAQEWPHAPVGDSHNIPAAFADYDHDGTIDVVTASTGGARLNLYRNDTDLGTNRWLEVRVPVTPGTGERGGISGRVVVKTGELAQFRDIAGGSSRASQHAMSVRFGLGQWTGAEWVAVLWPDGRQSVVVNVEGNRVVEMPAP
jgi:hypothetical protein